MQLKIPGYGTMTIKTIILDLNGTLTIDGKIIKGVEERLKKLQEQGIKLVLFSGDTLGNAAKIAKKLNLEFTKASSAKEKLMHLQKLNPKTCAAIGNGLIDHLKIKTAQLGIVTLQSEGVHTKTLLAADIVTFSILDALDLFLKPERLTATLKK